MKMKMKRGAGRVLFLRSDRVGHMCSGLRSVSLVNPDDFQSRRNLHSAPQSVVPDLPVSITGELVRNANSRALAQTYWITNLGRGPTVHVLTSPLGDAC